MLHKKAPEQLLYGFGLKIVFLTNDLRFKDSKLSWFKDLF